MPCFCTECFDRVLIASTIETNRRNIDLRNVLIKNSVNEENSDKLEDVVDDRRKRDESNPPEKKVERSIKSKV